MACPISDVLTKTSVVNRGYEGLLSASWPLQVRSEHFLVLGRALLIGRGTSAPGGVVRPLSRKT